MVPPLCARCGAAWRGRFWHVAFVYCSRLQLVVSIGWPPFVAFPWTLSLHRQLASHHPMSFLFPRPELEGGGCSLLEDDSSQGTMMAHKVLEDEIVGGLRYGGW